jgi:hypothetical protein
MTTAVTNTTKTLLQMRDVVYMLVNEDEDTFTTLDVNMALNSGLQNVWNDTKKTPQKISQSSVIAANNEYALPNPMLKFGNAKVWKVLFDDTELLPIAPVITDAVSGTPTGYWVIGNILYTDSLTDGVSHTMDVWYTDEYTTLSEDTDTTELSDIEIMAAIYYACYLLKIKDEEFQSSNSFFSLYDEQISRAVRQSAGVYTAAEYTYSGEAF